MTDAEPHAAILIAEMRRDRSQSVMAGDAATYLDADLARRQFELILKHGDLAVPELEEVRRFVNRASRFVHERRGAKQHHPFAIERAFGGLALKATAPRCETMTPRDRFDGHEADIVPVMRVLRAGIAETYKEQHDAASRVSARSAKVVAGFASDRASTYEEAHDLSPNRSHFGGPCALLLLVATTGGRLGTRSGGSSRGRSSSGGSRRCSAGSRS